MRVSSEGQPKFQTVAESANKIAVQTAELYTRLNRLLEGVRGSVPTEMHQRAPVGSLTEVLEGTLTNVAQCEHVLRELEAAIGINVEHVEYKKGQRTS